MFYTFNQNNSGGGFEDPAHFLIVEANSLDQAMLIAEDHGVYFNGCDLGLDCPCCGDRWHEPYDPPTDMPQVFGDSPAEYVQEDRWASETFPSSMIVYLDGRIERHYGAKR